MDQLGGPNERAVLRCGFVKAVLMVKKIGNRRDKERHLDMDDGMLYDAAALRRLYLLPTY